MCRQDLLLYRTHPFALFLRRQHISPFPLSSPFFFFYSPAGIAFLAREDYSALYYDLLRNRHEDVVGTPVTSRNVFILTR